MALHIETPLLASNAFDARPGARIWLKMEALQPSGSFKLRGIGHACETYAARGARRIVASSGGNAGLAAAYAARRLGLPCLVVVPETTSARARALLAREAAQVCVHGLSFQEANAHAQSLLGPQDAFIHPFDDPLLWEGHASMIDEVARAGLRPDCVVLSVGGGGLLRVWWQGQGARGGVMCRCWRSRQPARIRMRSRWRRASGSNCRRSPASRPRSGRERCRNMPSTWHARIRFIRSW